MRDSIARTGEMLGYPESKAALQRLQSSRLAAAMSALVFPEGWPGSDRCAPGMSALRALQLFAASGRPKPAFEAPVEGV